MDNAKSTLEEITAETVDSIDQKTRECLACCQERIREQPVCAVLSAAGIGYLLRFFPLTLIVGSFLRLVVALLKPALLVLGIIKILSCLQEKKGLQPEVEPLLDSPPGPGAPTA